MRADERSLNQFPSHSRHNRFVSSVNKFQPLSAWKKKFSKCLFYVCSWKSVELVFQINNSFCTENSDLWTWYFLFEVYNFKTCPTNEVRVPSSEFLICFYVTFHPRWHSSWIIRFVHSFCWGFNEKKFSSTHISSSVLFWILPELDIKPSKV